MEKIPLSHKELGCLHKDKEIIGTSLQLTCYSCCKKGLLRPSASLFSVFPALAPPEGLVVCPTGCGSPRGQSYLKAQPKKDHAEMKLE